MDRSMIDAASNTQQFGVRGSAASRVVNKIGEKITELTSLVRQLAIGQHHISLPVRMCGICAFLKHPIDACSILQETKPHSAKFTFLGGLGEADGYKKHSVSTKCDCYDSGLANIDWTIGHHCESTTVIGFYRQIPSQTITSPQANMSAITLRSGRSQPPLPSILQPLQSLLIITNKTQLEQKERILQDLKKLGDFYEHLVKHSTLKFLLKKSPEDVILKRGCSQ
ncbi:hypothetical protein CR513_31945, partial [Mucuna pruriens]